MDCPVCSQPMIALELDRVEIDHCLDCSSIWLDSGELEILLVESEKTESFLKSYRYVKRSTEQSRRCPICFQKMKKIYAGKKDLPIIDECKSGHGIWFDKGELSQVINECSHEYSEISKLLQDIFNKSVGKLQPDHPGKTE